MSKAKLPLQITAATLGLFALAGCSSSGGGIKTIPSDLTEYAIIDSPMNENVDKSCYERENLEAQLTNAYKFAKYIEGWTVDNPGVDLKPLVVMDNTYVDTEMNLDTKGHNPDMQKAVSGMSKCHEMYMQPLGGDDFRLKIRFKEKSEPVGELFLKDAAKLTDWQTIYSSKDSQYQEELVRILEEQKSFTQDKKSQMNPNLTGDTAPNNSTNIEKSDILRDNYLDRGNTPGK